MAKIPNVYLISIFLIMCSLSLPSEGLTFPGYKITSVVIEGFLYCNVSGRSNPVSNATINLPAGRSTTTIAQAVTDVNGAFKLVLSYLQTILFTPGFRDLGFTLPVGNSCGVLSQGTVNVPLLVYGVILNNTRGTAICSPVSPIIL